MSLKFTTQKDIREAEKNVAWFKTSIDRYKTIARGDKDGIEAALELMKEVRDASRRLQKDLFLKPNHTKILRALGLAGEERAYDHMITMFEDSKTQVQFYRSQLEEAQKYLDELNKLDIRE